MNSYRRCVARRSPRYLGKRLGIGRWLWSPPWRAAVPAVVPRSAAHVCSAARRPPAVVSDWSVIRRGSGTGIRKKLLCSRLVFTNFRFGPHIAAGSRQSSARCKRAMAGLRPAHANSWSPVTSMLLAVPQRARKSAFVLRPAVHRQCSTPADPHRPQTPGPRDRRDQHPAHLGTTYSRAAMHLPPPEYFPDSDRVVSKINHLAIDGRLHMLLWS